MANTLEGYRTGILNWCGFPISTGPLQGMHNKIKTLKRESYGYMDLVCFTLKLHYHIRVLRENPNSWFSRADQPDGRQCAAAQVIVSPISTSL